MCGHTLPEGLQTDCKQFCYQTLSGFSVLNTHTRLFFLVHLKLLILFSTKKKSSFFPKLFRAMTLITIIIFNKYMKLKSEILIGKQFIYYRNKKKHHQHSIFKSPHTSFLSNNEIFLIINLLILWFSSTLKFRNYRMWLI